MREAGYFKTPNRYKRKLSPTRACLSDFFIRTVHDNKTSFLMSSCYNDQCSMRNGIVIEKTMILQILDQKGCSSLTKKC